MDTTSTLILAALIFVAAVLYSSVGHAGASGYLAAMALFGFVAGEARGEPARAARVGLRGRVLTRVGAGDNLARGESTFMVEMAETSYILHHATDQSLVLMDEIGRGTSTYDGLALADAWRQRTGGRCFTASNQEHHRIAYLRDEARLGPHFDEIIYSAGLGVCKPDRVFFTSACRISGATTPTAVTISATVPMSRPGANLSSAARVTAIGRKKAR